MDPHGQKVPRTWPGVDNVHERVWERPAVVWRPLATYTLLGAMAAVFLLQGLFPYGTLWLVWTDWPLRPWSPLMSTFAHGGLAHLLLNGLVLYFFGPALERTLGRRAFVVLFLVTGAVSGIAQVELSAAWGSGLPALGASGAIMAVLGAMVVLHPRDRVLIYGVFPLPLWAMGVLYAALDVLGAFNAADGVGNFAHLAGMAMGLAYGAGLRRPRRLHG